MAKSKEDLQKEKLQELGIEICSCGILMHLETAKSEQYDYDRMHQRVICPICKSTIWKEK